MNYLATFDESGYRTASYIKGVHKNIPENAIEITEEDQSLYSTNLYFRNKDGIPELIEITPVILEPTELRKIAYQNDKIIEWNSELITVDEANILFTNYFAEGNTEKYESLRLLIISAKETIRTKYPDVK